MSYERLDRALSSVDWFHKFPSTVLLVLPIQRSDHSPLILNTIPSTQGKTRISRFEAAWLMDIAMKEIVGKLWPTPIQGSQAYSLMKHQQILIKHLRNWHHLQNRSLAARTATTQQQLLEIQQSNDLSSLHLDEQQLRSKSDDLYHQQEVYWSQRARQPWLQRGDKNTKFFHMAASLRSRKKKIMFLKLEDGTFTSDPLQIQQAFLNHFKNIYQTSDAPASGYPFARSEQ